LKRLVVSKSISDGHRVKRQLLFCFHPDKCPATDAATRITQILNSVQVGPGRSPRQTNTTKAPETARSSRTSPMRTGRNSVHEPSSRPQSARPRCRC
jgi:hypothetical protein